MPDQQLTAPSTYRVFSLPKPQGWPIERITGLMAGTVVLLSLALGRLHTGRWRLLTGWVGANLILNAVVGWCPMSAVLHRAGVPLAGERAGACRV